MLSITSYLSASKTVLKTLYSGHQHEYDGHWTEIVNNKIKNIKEWVKSSFNFNYKLKFFCIK